MQHSFIATAAAGGLRGASPAGAHPDPHSARPRARSRGPRFARFAHAERAGEGLQRLTLDMFSPEAAGGLTEKLTHSAPWPGSGTWLSAISAWRTAQGSNPDVANDMNDKSTMNKIMEYMALGKPIVQFDLTEGRFSAQEASLYAAKNDPVDMAAKIVELKTNTTATAITGSTQTILVCGRNRMTVPDMPTAARSSWDGSGPTSSIAARSARTRGGFTPVSFSSALPYATACTPPRTNRYPSISRAAGSLVIW